MNPLRNDAKKIILITGPTRSGKSEWGELLAQQSGKPVTYVATAQVNPMDKEWQERIQKHIQRRPSQWETLIAPRDLSATLALGNPDQCWLVDALGTWVANVLDQKEQEWEQTVTDLLACLQRFPGDVILIGEETGWGLVPPSEVGRKFRDRLGQLIRSIGAIADQVYLVTGGYVLDLTCLGKPLPSDSFGDSSN